jgi:hypothetical protein
VGSDTCWQEDGRTLGEVVKDIEGSDCHVDMSNDMGYGANYFNRPLIDASSPYELVSASTQLNRARNLTREVVDTSMATTCRSIHQSVIPVGGDFDVSTNCKILTRQSDGINEANDFESLALRVGLDARLYVVGAAKFYSEAGELKVTRMRRGTVFWRYTDEEDPSCVYTAAPVPKRRLARMFPRFKDAIMSAADYTETLWPGVDPMYIRNKDMIRVYEAWEKAEPKSDGKGIYPGKHTIAIDGHVLFEEQWTKTFTPIVFTKFADGPRGLAGTSLASIVSAHHYVTNWILDMVMESARGNTPKIFVKDTETVSQISDMAWQLVKHSGQSAPPFVTPNGISQQLLDLFPLIRTWAFAEGGTSESIGQSTRPTGLNSEPAQLAWLDIANIRAFNVQKKWEKFHKDCMKVKMGMAFDLYRDKEVRVMAPGSKMLDLIKWPADIREDQYSYVATVSSGLPLTMAGKLQVMQEIKAGAPNSFSEADFIRNLNMPDLEKTQDELTAPLTYVENVIDKALSEGVFVPSSRMQGVDGVNLLIKKASQRYQLESVRGQYPAAHLEVLRRVILSSEERLGIMNNAGQPQVSPLEQAQAVVQPAAAPAPQIQADAQPIVNPMGTV